MGFSSANCNYSAYLLIIDAVNDGDDRDDVDAVTPQIVNGAQLYVKQVANGAVGIGFIADTVKLQVGVTQIQLQPLALQNSGFLANSIPLVAACTLL